VSGNLDVAPDRLAIDGLKAEIDGGTLQGRVAVLNRTAGEGSRIEAALQADRLDLDAATAFIRSLADAGRMAGRGATISGHRPRRIRGSGVASFLVKLSYGPNTIALDQLKIGRTGGVTMEGAGSFDRANATGKLTLNASSASFAQFTALIAPSRTGCRGAAQCDGWPARPGASQAVARPRQEPDHATAPRPVQCSIFDAPDIKGVTTITANSG